MMTACNKPSVSVVFVEGIVRKSDDQANSLHSSSVYNKIKVYDISLRIDNSGKREIL